MTPCTLMAGRRMEDFCDDCGHVYMAHERGGVCSVCEVIEELRATTQKAAPSAAAGEPGEGSE